MVIIIPKKPKRYKTQLIPSRPLFEVDGASFYEMVTGAPTAMRDLFIAMTDILDRRISRDVKNYCQTVFEKAIPD